MSLRLRRPASRRGTTSTGRSGARGGARRRHGRIEDPNGEGPAIWFQVVPEKKSIKNRIHIDVNASRGRGSSLETRRERVEAEAARLVPPVRRLPAMVEEGLDHAVALTIRG